MRPPDAEGRRPVTLRHLEHDGDPAPGEPAYRALQRLHICHVEPAHPSARTDRLEVCPREGQSHDVEPPPVDVVDLGRGRWLPARAAVTAVPGDPAPPPVPHPRDVHTGEANGPAGL